MKDFYVVCVDDEQGILNLLSAFVESLGFTPKVFLTPQEALKFIRVEFKKVLIIISDYRFNDEVTGFDLKDSLKGHLKDIPFILITAFRNLEIAEKAMEKGVVSFIDKPIDETIFNEKIKNFSIERFNQLKDEREMILGFLEESWPLIEQIENLILKLEENSEDKETLSIYFRLLHTIKGTAACVGLNNLAEFSHKYEDYISQIKNDEIQVNKEVISILLNGIDIIKNIVESIKTHLSDNLFEIEKHLQIFNIKTQVQTETLNENKKEKNIVQVSKETPEKNAEERITVPMSILDRFMEESSELTIIRSSILKTVKKISENSTNNQEVEELTELLSSMYKLTSNIQNSIKEMRQIPIDTIFRPYKRLVRDLSTSLGKQISLTIEGANFSIDNNLAKMVSAIMIHMVRNAVDHGIDSPEERLKRGVSEGGEIKINTALKGDFLIITIQDNGRGINPQIIKNKALEKNIFTKAELDSMSEQQIIEIIFASGFSTATVISDVSGRGVGMDMVKGTVEAAEGTIQIKSTVNVGTTFEIIIPLPKSVLILNSLKVLIGGMFYIIPIDHVLEVIQLPEENNNSDSSCQILCLEGTRILKKFDNLYPMVDMQSLMGKPSSKKLLHAIVLKTKFFNYALLVDEVCDFEEVVLRKIPNFFGQLHFFQGASILGRGEMGLVIDVELLAIKAGIRREKESDKNGLNKKLLSFKNKQTCGYMLFKINKNESYAVPLASVSRLEKINKNEIQTSGDLQLVKYRGNKTLTLIDSTKSFNTKDSNPPSNDEFNTIVFENNGHYFGLTVEEILDIEESENEIDRNIISHPCVDGTLFIKEKTITVLNVKKFIESSTTV